jgi:uncharacterized UPF0160 family protein
VINIFKRRKVLVTHNGAFHADDVFACATLELVLEKRGERYKVVRSRDEADFARGDFVFDVGGIYDAEKNRFDHHQRGGAGVRENKIPYAAFGLVWKHFGKEIISSESIYKEIDEKFVSPIDAHDNGYRIYEELNKEILPVEISNVVSFFNSTWKENAEDNYENFLQMVSAAKFILRRLIQKNTDKLEGQINVEEAYEKARDKSVIVIDKNWPWKKVLQDKSDTIYVVYPSHGNTWHAQAIEEEMFLPRKPFPEDWAGESIDNLRELTGVEDVIFAHQKRFLVGAKSREGAIKLAKKALNS